MEYDSDVTLPSVTNDFQDSDSEALPELVSDGDSSEEDIAIEEYLNNRGRFCWLNIPSQQRASEKVDWQAMDLKRQNLQVFNHMLAGRDKEQQVFKVKGVDICPICFRVLFGIRNNRYYRLQAAMQKNSRLRTTKSTTQITIIIILLIM